MSKNNKNKNTGNLCIIPARATLRLDDKKTIEDFTHISVLGGFDYDVGFIDPDQAYKFLREFNTITLELTPEIQTKK